MGWAPADDCPICRRFPATKRAALHDFSVNDDEFVWRGGRRGWAPFGSEARRPSPPTRLVSLAEKIAAWKRRNVA